MKKYFLMFVASFLLMSQTSLAVVGYVEAEPELYDVGITEVVEVPTLYDMNPVITFEDVDYDTTYDDSILWMAKNGVINGYGDGKFGPDNCVNRAEMIKMLFEVLEIDESGYEAELFSDVPADAWYTAYVKAARAKGTVNGYDDGTFKPGQCVNRVEALKMAVLEFNNGTLPEFSTYSWGTIDAYEDAYDTDWYYDYLDYALESNVVGLEHTYQYSRNLFGTGDDMSRKEVAEMLYRMKVLRDNKLSRYNSWEKPFEIGAVPFYEVCEGEKLNGGSYDINDALPLNPTMVFNLDHYDTGVLNDLEDFVDKIPELGFWNDMMMGMDLDADLETLLGDKWEFLVGMEFLNEDVSLYSVDEDEIDMYVAAKVGDKDLMIDWLKDEWWMSYKSDITCVVEDEILYWTNLNNDMYGALVGDVFVMTNHAKTLNKAVDRVMSGNGYNENSHIDYDALSYISVDLDFFSGLISDLYSTMGMGMMDDYLASFADFHFWLNLNSKGMSLSSFMGLNSGENMIVDSYRGFALSLIDKINADGIVLYLENPNLSLLSDSLLMNMDYYMFDDPYGMYGVSDVVDTALDLENILSTELGLSVAEFDAIMDSPYAIAVHDVDQLVPGFEAYLKLDSTKRAAGNKVVNYLTSQVDVMIDKLNAESTEVDLGEYVVKSSSAISGLNKVSLSFVDMPEAFWVDSYLTDAERAKVSAIDLEFTYGITNDNIFVMALYPGFADDYSRNSLANNSDYLSAVDSLSGVYGAGVTYVDIDNMMSVVDMFVDFADEGGAEYDEFKSFVSAFDYMISSAKISGGEMESKMVLGF